jgi:hypothetical protein
VDARQREGNERNPALRLKLSRRADQSETPFLEQVIPLAIGPPRGNARYKPPQMDGDDPHIFADETALFVAESGHVRPAFFKCGLLRRPADHCNISHR